MNAFELAPPAEIMPPHPEIATAMGMLAVSGVVEKPATAGVYRSTGTGEAEFVRTEEAAPRQFNEEQNLQAVGMARLSHNADGRYQVATVSEAEKAAYLKQRKL